MNIIQSIMTNNPCYKAGKKITVRGLMLHSVGCPQPSAAVFINQYNKPTYTAACVHGFIDANTGDVYQTLPWNHRGWHGGKGKNGCCNDTHIGIEMCEPSQIKYTSGSRFTCSDTAAAKAAVQRTYTAAVELFAYLCKLYGLNPLTDICSHREGCTKGIATNHGDPEHLWNGLGTGYTMDGFRRDVKNYMNNEGGLTMTQYDELKAKNAAQDEIINVMGKELAELRTKLSEAARCCDHIDSSMPQSYKPTIQKLVGRGCLQGDETGKLHLTEDMMRILTILDRTGVFG